jgi:hypothetical protein
MQYVLRLWYVASGPWVIQRYLTTIRIFDGTFAVRDTWKNMSRPLFQDYTWQGRIIGVFLRLFRIGVAAIIYFTAAVFYLIVYLIWLLFPVICLASLIGGFIGPEAAATPLSL